MIFLQLRDLLLELSKDFPFAHIKSQSQIFCLVNCLMSGTIPVCIPPICFPPMIGRDTLRTLTLMLLLITIHSNSPPYFIRPKVCIEICRRKGIMSEVVKSWGVQNQTNSVIKTLKILLNFRNQGFHLMVEFFRNLSKTLSM